MEAGAAKVAVHKQRLLTSVGVGDRKMGGDRRLPLTGSGTGEHNRTQPPFEIRQQDGIAYRPNGLFEIGSRAIVSLSISTQSGLGHGGARRGGRCTFRELSLKSIDWHRPNDIRAEKPAGLFGIAERRIERVLQQRSADR